MNDIFQQNILYSLFNICFKRSASNPTEIVISETSRPPIPNKNPLLRLKKIEPKNPSVDNKIQNRANSIKIFKGL